MCLKTIGGPNNGLGLVSSQPTRPFKSALYPPKLTDLSPISRTRSIKQKPLPLSNKLTWSNDFPSWVLAYISQQHVYIMQTQVQPLRSGSLSKEGTWRTHCLSSRASWHRLPEPESINSDQHIVRLGLAPPHIAIQPSGPPNLCGTIQISPPKQPYVHPIVTPRKVVNQRKKENIRAYSNHVNNPSKYGWQYADGQGLGR